MSAADVMAKMQKAYGTSVVSNGSHTFADTERLPTGIFPLDMAMGGGFPMGKVSIIYGPESSNKTNIVLKAIAEGQKRHKGTKKAVFVDVEHGFDPEWATKLGVDVDDLIVVSPEYAEQAVDLTEAFLYADDVFCVALDSIAALTTQNEINSGAEKMIVGGASLLNGKLFKKATITFTKMRNAGLMPPAFIAINQIRFKIGVMFGDPETMPGGNAPKYASSMTVRVYGKNVMDTKLHAAMPAYKDTSVIIRKWKVPILSVNSQFKMQMLDVNGNPPGFIEDWNTISNYMKELDYLGKAEGGKGWSMLGEVFPTLDACKQALYGNIDTLQEVKATIISELMNAGKAIAEGGEELAEEEAEE